MLDDETAALKWKRPARTVYYRVWMRVKGVDSELMPVASTKDPDFIFEKVPPGSDLEFAISALNPGGESVRSELAGITPLDLGSGVPAPGIPL